MNSFSVGSLRSLSRRFFFVFGLVLAMAIMPSMAEARGRGKGGGGLAKELGLSPEQATQVREIRAKYKDRIKETGKASRAAKKDLVASLQAPQKGESYNAELMKKFKEVQVKKQEQHTTRFEMALEIRNILTDAQIAKFKALHRGGKRGHHHGGDDGDDDKGDSGDE